MANYVRTGFWNELFQGLKSCFGVPYGNRPGALQCLPKTRLSIENYKPNYLKTLPSIVVCEIGSETNQGISSQGTMANIVRMAAV